MTTKLQTSLSGQIMEIAIVILLLVVGYLFGKTQRIEQKQNVTALPTSIPTIIISTPTPIPAVKQNPAVNKVKVVDTPIPIPTERKKVAVTLIDPSVAGTYYCYEDKANELMSTQNALKLTLDSYNVCLTTKQMDSQRCLNDCLQSSNACSKSCDKSSPDYSSCTSNCLKQQSSCSDGCINYINSCDTSGYENLRTKLIQSKNNYCP